MRFSFAHDVLRFGIAAYSTKQLTFP